MDIKVEKVLKNIEKMEKTKSFGSIPRSTGQFLQLLVLATNSKKILELGCSLGYSTIWMASAVKKTGGHIYSTEIDQSRIKLAKINFKAAKLEKYITLIENDIMKVLSDWEFGKMDFVFIDAKKEEYFKYYKRVLPLLKNGGLIVADDVGKYRHEMKVFIQKVKNDSHVVSQFLEIDDGLMLICKNKIL